MRTAAFVIPAKSGIQPFLFHAKAQRREDKELFFAPSRLCVNHAFLAGSVSLTKMGGVRA